MAEKEPLLRMAISRGFVLDLRQENNNEDEPSKSESSENNSSHHYPSGESKWAQVVL